MDYLFNFRFTRPDEDNATVYHVGMHVEADTQADAEQRLRERNAHLTVLDVELWSILTEDGDIVYSKPYGGAYRNTADIPDDGDLADTTR